MSVIPATWSEWYRTARSVQYQHPRALEAQVEALKPACPDLAPYVYRDPAVGALLLCKGKMLNPTPDGKPPVFFAITLKPQFPNAYPIMTVDPPPAGWRFKNHPHVDREGMCYLNSITSWNPTSSSIFNTCAELQQVLSANHPYERDPGTSQQQRVPQQQQQQQPQPQQQQQQYHQRPAQAGPASATGIAVGIVSAFANSLIGPTAQQTRAADGSQVPVLSAADEQRAREQRERDRAWLLQQQQQQQHQQRGQQQHQLVQSENAAAVDFIKERFTSILAGQVAVPPNTEIATPPDFGLLGRIRTHPAGVAGPLMLTRRAAPRPLPPVMDPTPDEHYHLQREEKDRQRQNEEQQQARAPPPAGALNVGLRALSRGVSVMGNLAAKGKQNVEEKVRQNTISQETQRFALLFPTPAGSGERMISNYHCRLICGDGVARKGYLFITEFNLYFSSKLVPGDTQPITQGGAQPVVVQTQIPYRAIVSLALGTAVQSKCLHVICHDNSVRTFLDFHANKLVEYGSYVSDAVKGTALDRCYNWIDHKWRAHCPGGIVPGYPYEAPLDANGEAPPAATGAGTGGYDVPVPGPMYSRAAPAGQQQPAPAAVPSPTSSDAPPPESMLCAICMEQPKNCFLRPCGHVAACMGCAGQLRTCPICRSAIQDRFQAFI
jgi:hypothetical protein